MVKLKGVGTDPNDRPDDAPAVAVHRLHAGTRAVSPAGAQSWYAVLPAPWCLHAGVGAVADVARASGELPRIDLNEENRRFLFDSGPIGDARLGVESSNSVSGYGVFVSESAVRLSQSSPGLWPSPVRLSESSRQLSALPVCRVRSPVPLSRSGGRQSRSCDVTPGWSARRAA